MNMDNNTVREYEKIIDENIRLLKRLKHTFYSKDYDYYDGSRTIININRSKISRTRKTINENLIDLERGKLWNF